MKKSPLRFGQGNTNRFTVQLSNDVIMRVQDRAVAEGIPMSAVVRRAVMIFLMELAAVGGDASLLVEIDLADYEDRLRRKRGPMAMWPERVNYALKDDVAAELQHVAEHLDRSVADLAREAVIRHVAFGVADAPPATTRNANGFVRAAPRHDVDGGAETRRRG
jgi:predicted transcriptional regulator